MNPLVKNILALHSIKRLRFFLKAVKIPEAEASTLILIEQTVKNKQKLRKHQRCISVGQIVRQVIRCLRLRYYHYPIQYALGIWYFRNLTIQISPPLLIPRFETEYFVTLMVDTIRSRFPKGSSLALVDYCCGCGVIGLSILKQLGQDYQLNCVFVDIHPKAIQYTRINAVKNDVELSKLNFIRGDLRDYLYLMSTCDVVVSNPPYISKKEYNRLEHQVRLFQDPKALQSGSEGLDLVTILISQYMSLTKKPLLGLEYGGQPLQQWGLEQNILVDQYGRRRYMIV